MRLDKAIANNSSYTRKEITKLIHSKHVIVNDQIITDPGFKIDINNDIIKINNELFNIIQNIYIALNKPKGYVCSNSNKDGDSVLNLIKENYFKNIHIVGRLDKDTTGLVLITNDGQFTHKIKSSKYQVAKEYEVILRNEFTNQMMEQLQKDVFLDGKKLKPFQIKNINKNKLNIVLIEGKYHQIKRLFQLVNNEVIELHRIRINNLNLNNLNLKIGEYALLNREDFDF